MPNFSLTPAQIRAIAGQWQREGAAVCALDFSSGLGAADGSASIAGLLHCAHSAETATARLGGSFERLGSAVHRFSELTRHADAEAAGAVAAALDGR